MENSLFHSLFLQYWQSQIPLEILRVIGIICFFKLPKEKRANIFYWLPFLILNFHLFYKNFGSYTNYNYEFKASVNAFLGNTEFPLFNLWLYNIARRQIEAILFLILIRISIVPSKKKYFDWMIVIFIVAALFLQISGIELLYLNQPIIFAIGANMILLGCAIYFIDLISNKQYLEKNPLRLLSFWQMTTIMFTFSLSYISSVALLYLYQINPRLGEFLQNFGTIMYFFTLAILTLTIVSPLLPNIFEEEPSVKFKKEISLLT